jgi:alpha-tubulin suppressor-like RCC1 family protein
VITAGEARTSLKPMTRTVFVCVTVIFAVALGFRFWLLHSYGPAGPWVAALTLSDAEMGRNLLAGRGWVANADMVERATKAQEGQSSMVDLEELLPVDDNRPGVMVNPGSTHSPGYSLWFALSYWLGGHLRYVYSQRMQAVLDAVGCLLVFGIGRRVWSSAAGLVAAVLYAVSPAHAFLANLTVAASTDSLWFLATAYGAVRAWDVVVRRGGRPWRETLLIGGASLCGAAMNSTSITLPAVVTAAALVISVFDRRALMLAPYFLAAQLLVYLLLTPWAMRNDRMFGQFSFVRGGFWQLAFASFGELPNPWGMGFDDKYYWNWIDENCAGCSPGQQAGRAREFILHTVLPSPGFTRHVANLVELRLPRLLTVTRVSGNIFNPNDSARTRNVLRRWLSLGDASSPVVAVLVFLGIGFVLMRKEAVPVALLAIAPSLFLIAFSLVFYVELRKTVPAYGGLFVFAGIGVAEVGARLARRRGIVGALLVMAVLQPRPAAAAVMAAGQMHSVVVKPDGTVWSWGTDTLGQLGDGVLAHTTADDAWAKNLFDVVAVAAGGNHTLALRQDGTVWAWGDNLWGELGDGRRTTRAVPARVPGLDRIVAIAAGYLHSLALAADGSLWAWGDNHYGQLGTGTTTPSLMPVRVQGLSNVTTIGAGFFHSVAIDRAGHVFSWGQNTHGQLGHGGPQPRKLPTEMSSIREAVAITAGQFHTLALRRDGTVWSWGGNTFGQLGRGITAGVTSADDPAPAAVPGLLGVTMIAAGEDHSAALTSDGQVWTWGDNLYGQLGDGTWEVRRRPVKAVGIGPVTAIASGHAHLLVSKADGTILTWGYGYDGQLGDNAVTRRVAVPRAVTAVSLAPVPRFDSPSFHPVGRADAPFMAPVAKFQNGTFVVRGEAESETAYVIAAATTTAGPVEERRVLTATGTIFGGCATVGVQEHNRWVFTKNVSRPGPFTITWAPPAKGEYTIVIAHCLPVGERHNDFEITHLGWFGAARDGLR